MPFIRIILAMPLLLSLTLPAGAQTKHALLVGVSDYEHLDPKFNLVGPANDVLLMQDLLETQFGFPKANIKILAEHQGKSGWGTRANIEAEFKRLAQVAKKGDQVFIMMGGHGSQQPEDPDAKEKEPDGLDEIFLPRDVGTWDGGTGRVKNAILDDEIGVWLKAIQDRDAHIFIMFDSCHSGTMVRGVNERARQCDPTGALGIPQEVLTKAAIDARKKAVKKRGGSDSDRNSVTADRPGIVALYACQSNEVTLEQNLPVHAEDAKSYGLLSFTLNEVVRGAAKNGGKTPTYRELIQRVHAKYKAMGRNSPTPEMEGDQEIRDREFLGVKAWPGKARIVLKKDGSKWKINQGALTGMTEGSVLAVYPPVDEKDADKIVGHVEVSRVQMFSASVRPCDFEKIPANSELPDGGRCEVVSLDYGIEKLKVALDPEDDDGKPLTPEVAKRVLAELDKAVGRASQTVTRVPDFKDADWLVRWHKNQVFLVPAKEWSKRGPEGGALFGPFEMNDKLPFKLESNLHKVARVANLRKIIAMSEETTRGGADENQLKLDIELHAVKGDALRGTVLKFGDAGLKVYDEDAIRVHIKNASRFAIDLTVLYIDSDYGILALYPVKGRELNRLKSGESAPAILLDLIIDETIKEKLIDPKTKHVKAGLLENLIFLAAKSPAEGEPLEFTGFAQSSLDRARDWAIKPTAINSPLGKVFQNGLYGAGTTRAVKVREVEQFGFTSVPWTLRPEYRPKQ